MTTTTLTPFIESTATAVQLADGSGGKWQKEILPSGTRKYKGQTLDFSVINPAVVQAFKDKAFDQVPFQFATATNDHNDDPERMKGELSDVTLSDDGRVMGIFDFTNYPETSTYVTKNPKFGVSSRIEVGYVRSDDEKPFKYALSHVLGTLKPHIRGMSGWERVELSDKVTSDDVLDLSTEVEDRVEETTEEKGPNKVPVTITEDEYKVFKDFLAEQQSVIDALNSADDSDKGEVAKLSESDSAALVKAQQDAADAISLAEAAQVELAQTRWASQKRDLVLAGVPPFLLDLAEPVMSQPHRATIELSEDKTVDATEIIGKILDGCKGFVNLSEEEGSQARDESGKKAYTDFEADFMSTFPQ